MSLLNRWRYFGVSLIFLPFVWRFKARKHPGVVTLNVGPFQMSAHCDWW